PLSGQAWRGEHCAPKCNDIFSAFFETNSHLQDRSQLIVGFSRVSIKPLSIGADILNIEQ
ncbi:TPA: hypothetical protein ACK0K3_004908, partial [Enterobacter hormaechei]